MEKKSIIKESQYKGEKESKYGILHNYFLKMENGDTGYISSKIKDIKYEAGNELEYTIEVIKIQNGNFNKFKKVSKQVFGGQKEKPQEKMIGFAMSYTKDLIIADKVSIDKLEDVFNRILDLMISKL